MLEWAIPKSSWDSASTDSFYFSDSVSTYRMGEGNSNSLYTSDTSKHATVAKENYTLKVKLIYTTILTNREFHTC